MVGSSESSFPARAPVPAHDPGVPFLRIKSRREKATCLRKDLESLILVVTLSVSLSFFVLLSSVSLDFPTRRGDRHTPPTLPPDEKKPVSESFKGDYILCIETNLFLKTKNFSTSEPRNYEPLSGSGRGE